MKICIPVTGPEGLQAVLQPDFTAAEHILIYNLKTGEHRTFSRDGDAANEADEEPITVDAVLCADMHPQVLRAFAAQGIQVFATEADTVELALQALQQGEAEELIATGGGCCGGGHHAHADDHECCGGHGHGEGEGCGCGGEGHGHGHSHGDDHECCGGKGHADDDHECCGGKGHAQAGVCGCKD
ncbi:MAG: NifB/NifX family molybdenum-iron cluster-binding protein [Formivibrio sp.]|nr:NifB/NifX family molybdenum-iron cluster-binding protein [Formivibrio sp.]